ncbi:Glycosyl hydrolase [Criblamydia sequanensis CRIB-18]|uniref:Glycosyl hydrolase n=2 Tax=Candidatus Criblamydia sequanensis TaxID=340071 RepID=A0A090CYC6_9BACT|nr:Glycosyl hydrolase [Criblamydia sequanensis CRIB-18]
MIAFKSIGEAMPYQPIENYGIIGDLHSVALVGLDGSIDYMCFPNFDSPSIFAALLDDKKGGRFKIAPRMEKLRRKQLYLPDSNILLTRFLNSSGIGEVSDFMVIDETRHAHTLVRRAKAVRGEILFEIIFDLKFDYGRTGHKIIRKEKEILFIPDKENLPRIRLIAENIVWNEKEEGILTAEVLLKAGESMAFIMEEAKQDQPSPTMEPDFASTSFKNTLNFWQKWISQSTYQGRWREMVNRSALVLKLLTSKKYGSIVAAPTFGVPEEIGGTRNWDYRYTWIRDASFTLYALMRLGYTEEARSFMNWIEERCQDLNPDGSLQIMYGLDGRKILVEETLSHFEGYMGSRPVRIGNAAFGQMQLDIYGELMDSVYIYNKYGEPISIDMWENLTRLIAWVINNWQRKDEGIWEVRSGKQDFLYSKLMCWVAIDRGVRLALKRSFPAPLDHWIRVRNEIYKEIVHEYWNPAIGAFVQYKGSNNLDASSLLMPMVKFVGPTDPKWLSTLEAIKKELVDDSLVYRYRIGCGVEDGIEGREGTFNMCSFWYVECLSRAGNYSQARFLLEKMFGYANHLGLYAEEMGADGRQLGNFPQAFTHLALISAAINLNKNLSQHKISW